MRRTYVHPSGDPNAKIAVVGEQPGVEEIRARPPKPFIGPAGRGLDECLQMTQILRRELYVTNVIKDMDKPIKSYIDMDSSRNKWTISEEGYQYIKELGEELKKVNPNVIIACGNIALLALTNRIGITKWRGSVIESTLIPGIKIVPTFHPATFIPPKFNFLNKPLICQDLLLAKSESEYPEIIRTPRNVRIQPDYNEAIGALEHCFATGLKGQKIALDIEIINKELDCISIGWGPVDSMSIPFKGPKGDYFNPDQEVEIMKWVARLIEHPDIRKVGANFIFDLQFLFRKYGIRPRGDIHCTQIAQKISYPDFPAGLDFVTAMYTDIPYYKADGKQWIKMGTGTWEEWWNYSGLDSIVPIEAIDKQIEVLDKQGNIDTYNRQRKLIEPLIYMAERGIKVDIQGMIEYRDKQQESLGILVEDLHKSVGYEINENSPQQLMKYFYDECKIRPYKKRNSKGNYVVTTDVDALKRISRLGQKGSEAAKYMLDIRSLGKRISTYLDVGKVDEDGRYRSSYKPVGTDTGRLSSGETIFGTGGNQQNWPHDLLRFFIFDEGYIGYSWDLSQIENRIVAHVGRVIPQIEAFERGVDLHRLTASIIFGKPYDEISDEDGSSMLGDGRQSERFWGKKGNHAINYDLGYKTFALKYEMPENDAKRIMETIHRGYPQIREGYQVLIQNMLRESRTITNLFGRNRLFLGPIVVSFPNVPKSAVEATYREAYAQLPQSTTADKINEHGVEYIYYNQDMFRPIELFTQIHDSIAFQIPLSIPWIEHARMHLNIKKSLELPLTWHGSTIETPADLSMGLNMCKEDMVEFKHKNIPNTEEELARELEKSYNKLINKGA